MKKTLTLLALVLAGTAQAQITNPAPYCGAEFDDPGNARANAIREVTLGSLNNNSGGQYAAPHYVFYNNLTPPDLAAGVPQQLQLGFNVVGNGCGWGVWIDFNQNNTFEESEKIAGSTGTAFLPTGPTQGIGTSVTIPTTALNGLTRMRVRIVEDNAYTTANGASILPCNIGMPVVDTMDWGETEDYTVNLVVGGTPPPNPNGLDFSSNRTVGFTNTNFTLSDNNNQNPTARQWIFIPNKVIYQAATNAGSARPIVRFTDTGTYSVKLVTTFANGKDSAQRTGYIRINPMPSGLTTADVAPSLEVFPNPATGVVNFTGPLQNAALTLTNITGVTVLQTAQFSGARLDVSSFAEGIYLLRITQAGETVTKRIFLKR